ncbi:MAG TPA: HNH endonuclease signature motif containing protein [Candidatus Nanoarchaeia archaeon]|nr:HNH endonuclease signature motif containing protein [Candidatus Nanoarchaeia archaeon]
MRDDELILALIVIAAVVMILTGIRRRRDAINHNLNTLVLAAAVGLIVAGVAQVNRVANDGAILLGGIAACVVAITAKPRSRHIPKRTRRQVIAAWERETGETYNRRKHELDHDVPFSRGGSHTEDNLRVRTKRVNRKKGAKSPWWDLLGN